MPEGELLPKSGKSKDWLDYADKCGLIFICLLFYCSPTGTAADKVFWVSEAALAAGTLADSLITYHWVYQTHALTEGNPALRPIRSNAVAVEGTIVGTAAVAGVIGWYLEKHKHSRSARIVLFLGAGGHTIAAISTQIQGQRHQ